MSVQPLARSRPRQARSIANDARILDATVSLLDSAGWEGTSAATIAVHCGLSRAPVLERYRDRMGVVTAAWDTRLWQVMHDALQNLVLVADSPSGGDGRLAKALRPFLDPDQSMRAAIEVLLVARFEDRLRPAVESTAGTALDAWLTPGSRITKTLAARRAMAIALALGMLVEVRTGHRAPARDLDVDIAAIARALRAPVSPRRLPDERAEHLLATPVFADADPALAALWAAMLDEVGERGYEGCTLQNVARTCGFTKGLIFARYDNKLELFIDATNRMLALAGQANMAFMERIAAETSAGVADAVMTREFMRPELRNKRTITTEQYRLAWHNERLQAQFAAVQDSLAEAAVQGGLAPGPARARAFISYSRGIGMLVLADLHPTAWALPYDVVVVPLNES